MAKTPEAGHHLVGDVEHIVFSADVVGPLLIALRRNDYTAGGEQGLGDEAGDLVGAKLENLLLEVADALIAELLLRHALRPAIGVGHRQVVDGVLLEIQIAAVARLAGDGGAEIGAAVIGIFPGDDVLLLRLAGEVEEVLNEAQGGIDGGGPAGGEEHMLQIAGRVFRQLGAELDGRRRRDQAEGRIVAEAPRLIGDGLHHLLAGVADIHAPHPAHAVDHLLAVGVVDIDALGLGDDQRPAGLRRAQLDPGMDDVLPVQFPERLRFRIGDSAA